MAKFSSALVNFNAGEFSPQMDGRTDIAKYGAACSKLENFIPRVQGPARRRGGTRYVATVKNSANRTWLTPFIFNVTQSYVLEWGDSYVRFYTNHGQVVTAPNTPLELATPYAATDLVDSNGEFALKFAQDADVLRITNANKTFPPYKLSRVSALSWTMTEIVTKSGPFKATNSDDSPCVFASAQTGPGITLKASAALWTANHIGELFRLEEKSIRDIDAWEPGRTITKGDLTRYNSVTYKAIKGGVSGTVPPTHFTGAAPDGTGTHRAVWQYQDPGYGWVKITAIGSLTPSGETDTITGITAASPAVVTAANTLSNGDVVFITGVAGMTEINDRFYVVASASGTAFALQDAAGNDVDATTFGAYSSGGTANSHIYTATADVVSNLPFEVVGSDGATSIWAHGAWSDAEGYPAAVCFNRERVCYGRDQNIWHSVSEDFEEFADRTPGGQVTADMAISSTIPTLDEIRWLVSGRDLVIGTGGSIYIAGEVNANNPLGPANIRVKEALPIGAARTQALKIGQAALFMQIGSRKLREATFSFQYDSYISEDLTVLAEHVTKGGTGQMVWQAEPDNVLWAVRDDGELLGFTYNKEQTVTGWHRHPLGGSAIVESIASIPSPDGSREDLWLIAKRTINGATVRFVEWMESQAEQGDDVADDFYMDAGLSYSGAATTTLSNLDHLEGETVRVNAAGTRHPDCVVTGGQIALNRKVSKAQVGLATTATLVTMRLEGGSQMGTSQSKIKRTPWLAFRFFDTLGGKYGPEALLDDVQGFRHIGDKLDTAAVPYTGDIKKLPWPGGYDTDMKLAYVNDTPFRASIVAIYPFTETIDP